MLTSSHLHRFQPSQSGKLFGREVGKVRIRDIDHIKPIFNYKNKDNCFELILKSGPTRVPRILRANTKDEATKWVKLLCDVVVIIMLLLCYSLHIIIIYI